MSPKKKRDKELDTLKKEQEKASKETFDEYIAKVKEKNERILLKLDETETNRIIEIVLDNWWANTKKSHSKIESNVEKWDEQWRMKRKKIPGTPSDSPDYRQGLGSVILEVMHANIMHTFFSHKDVMNALPTEKEDIKKMPNVSTFENWSYKNELQLISKCDRLFHNSGKVGGTPYKMYWDVRHAMVTKTRTIPNPFDPAGGPLIDPNTKKAIEQEYDEPKVIYDAPVLEIFSRKDFIIPEDSVEDKPPKFQIHRLKFDRNDFAVRVEDGRFYDDILDTTKSNYIRFDEKSNIKQKKTVFEVCCGFILKEADEEDMNTVEEEYIITICVEDRVVCAAKKNKFPLKMRPTNLCRFMNDDEGNYEGIGVMEFTEGVQTEYDAFHNQAVLSTVNENSPIVFFTPLAGQKTVPTKLKSGYAYPTADPNGVKIFNFPGPSMALFQMMKLVLDWAEKIFPMGEYAAGKVSEIDPDAPAKKVGMLLQQVSVRMNLVILRFNLTLKDIFLRHFLLYADNMPENKRMRITGEKGKVDFKDMTLADFDLKGLPDFELTGNVMSANKALEAQKAAIVYAQMIQNPFFNPKSPTGAQALYQITKWYLDKMDAMGVSDFIPKPEGTFVHTPEEENAMMLQGENVEPSLERDDHLAHIRTVNMLIRDPSISPEVKQTAAEHLQIHIKMSQAQLTQASTGGFGERGPERRTGQPAVTA